MSLAVLRASALQDDGAPPAKAKQPNLPGGLGGPPRGFGGPGGPPGGPGGPPGGFGPGMFLAPQVLELADSDKDGRLSPDEAAKAAAKFIRDADTDKKGSIDAQALGRAMNKRMGPPPGFGPGVDDDEPGGPPPGFGPGTFMAPGIVEYADTNKDGRISPDEAAAASERFLRDADSKKSGSLDNDALAAAINRRIGPPPGFGPGGPGGPGGPMGQERKLVKQFDKDADGRLNRPMHVPPLEEFLQEGTHRRRRSRAFSDLLGFPVGVKASRLRSPDPASSQPVSPPFPPKATFYEPTILRRTSSSNLREQRLGNGNGRFLQNRRRDSGHADGRRQALPQRRRAFPRAFLILLPSVPE